MSALEYRRAVEYSWMAFTQRRVDYWIAKAFGDGADGTPKGKEGRSIDWTPINPVAQELARKKREMIREGTIIPPYIKKSKV